MFYHIASKTKTDIASAPAIDDTVVVNKDFDILLIFYLVEQFVPVVNGM